ncbi:unnamed protein product [marine sediment metagenome]|uniref:Ribonucleotide reductase large subunit N-terminal domain-containing protein n=1 Tax=marine sediment metagenome TaxID=412755 RepID=X1BCY4_9ZZZZ
MKPSRSIKEATLTLDFDASVHASMVDKRIPEIQKSLSQKEVLVAATKYFGGDELAAKVWMNKYALKDSTGKFYEKTPDDMHRRMAREIARIEKNYLNGLHKVIINSYGYIGPGYFGSIIFRIDKIFHVRMLNRYRKHQCSPTSVLGHLHG